VPAALSPEEALKARWQRLVREADERIRDAEHAVESAKKTLDVAANQVVLMTTGHTMAARAAAVEALKKAEAEVEVARKAKVDLLERARLENVPPGYLR
jgi:sugar-specific transcriptional regulator TrmB